MRLGKFMFHKYERTSDCNPIWIEQSLFFSHNFCRKYMANENDFSAKLGVEI